MFCVDDAAPHQKRQTQSAFASVAKRAIVDESKEPGDEPPD
jgi:hypothetical protein